MEFNLNYEIIYFNFVKKFKEQKIENGVYTEKHHIIPRYAGGSDDEENLVVVTYRQHIFLHKVLYAWKSNPQDAAAIKLMSGIDVNKKLILCSMAGKIGGLRNAESGHIQNLSKIYGSSNGLRNVESGHLDRIRKLCHTEAQKEHLRKLCEFNKSSGHLDKIRVLAHEANRNREWTEEQRDVARLNMQKRCENPEYIEKLKAYSKISAEKKKHESYKKSLEILNQEKVYKEYLHMTPKKQSKYYFVTPTGLRFASPSNMANYFGKPEIKSLLESWCKHSKNGWYVELKSAQE